jgi:hypothetical protein
MWSTGLKLHSFSHRQLGGAMGLTFYIHTSSTPYPWFSVLCCRGNSLQWIPFSVYYYWSWEMRINFIQSHLHCYTYEETELMRVNYCYTTVCSYIYVSTVTVYLFYLCKEIIYWATCSESVKFVARCLKACHLLQICNFWSLTLSMAFLCNTEREKGKAQSFSHN